MLLATKLASLGHSARNQAGIKVRQPLPQVDFSVSSHEEATALLRYADLLADELNVKQVHLLGSVGEAVSYSLKPLPKQLGQKYKGLFPKIAQAIQKLDPEQAAQTLLAGEAISVEVDGEGLEILPAEVEVRAEARSGLVVSEDGPYLAALHTALTPALIQEGLAREFVRRVQDLRKQAGFEIADRIDIQAHASDLLAQALRTYQSYIMGETLAVKLSLTPPPAAESKTTNAGEAEGRVAAIFEFEGERASVLLIRQG
jgi:isoleucyl-tRNA synthetase